MYYRLPFYIALTDLNLMITQFLNLIHSVIYRSPWSYPFCQFLGFAVEEAQCLNQFLFTIVAVSIYLKISKDSKIDLGRYDWKLFTLMFILTMLATIPPIKIDAYGAQESWCGLKPGNQFASLYFLLLAVANLLITAVSYIKILLKLRKSRYESSSSTHNSKSIENRVAKKIALHVLVFLLQWLPVNIYTITFYMEITDFWTMIVAAIGINMGGIGNALAYAYNIDVLHCHTDGRKADDDGIPKFNDSETAVLQQKIQHV
ncbi:9831_t:CDS:2, partial [Ambispora leptoticha]